MNLHPLVLFDKLAEQEKAALSGSFASRHDILSDTTKILREMTTLLRQQQCKTHEAIWNPCLFLNTAAYDLSILVFEIAYEKDDWKRRLFARYLVTILFETAEDLRTVFGRDFNKALADLNVPIQFRDAFRDKLKAISRYWDAHRAQLKDIRLICGAHRDHDAILMHETIDNLDLLDILRMGVELGNMLNEIGPAAQEILTVTSSIQPPESTGGNAP